MQQTIEVSTADFAVAGSTFTLESKGIGSCVVICLYDDAQKIGALCHIMLPKQIGPEGLNPLRFADTAIPLALKELERMGSHHLIAQLAGGASMFQNLGPFINNIGEQNITAVKQILEQHGIYIATMDVGGNKGRSVSFALDTGEVTVTSKV